MVSFLTIALEQESIQIPINSRYIINGKLASTDDDADGESRKLTMQERAIFIEADALQIELGNIVGRQGAGGNVLFDTARSTMHKDRFSAFGMGVHYIAGLEEVRKRRLIAGNSSMVYGIVSSIY